MPTSPASPARPPFGPPTLAGLLLGSPLAAFAAALLLAGPAGPVAAQEVTLQLPPDADPDLRTVLENASLALSLGGEGLDQAQDYVAAARADYRRLLTGLYAEGYYGGAISITVDGREASGIQPFDAPDRISRVVISVAPGPRFSFGRTAIGPLAPDTVLPPGFATGEVARSETVREAVRAAVAQWREEGNAKAAVADQDLVAVQPEARLDVSVAIAPGPVLSFGPVTVTGNEAVRTERVLAIAGIPEGLRFSPETLERAATRLRRTGAFDAVALIEADEPGPGDTLPVTLQVTESLPRRVGFAAEISSLDGVSATAFWLHRNLLGGAERLRIEGTVAGIEGAALDTAGGGVDYGVGVTFARPATLGPDTDLTVDFDVAREDADDYVLSQAEIDVGFVRYVGDDLLLSAAVGFLVAEERTEAETFTYALVTLPLGATLDRRDNAQDAKRGFYIDAEATPFLSVAGDGAPGGRLYADARYYRSVGPRLTFAARGQAGSILAADREEVPANFAFFAGGGGSVRGQPYQSLGIDETFNVGDDAFEITEGGGSLLGAQVEARVGITDRIGAVAFYDAAVVGEGSFPDADSPFEAGTGLGVRYGTPVGPIRLDVATPASGDDAFREVQVYIGIGQAF